MIKVLKISTSQEGGAAIAALRMQEALNLNEDVTCDYLYARINEDYSEKIEITKDGSFIEIIIPANYWHHFGILNNALIDNNRTNISNTWFSLSLIEAIWDDEIFKIANEYDVIHFHWITQLVSLGLVRRLNQANKKIYITSHDENFFTGGCHYSAGCTRYSKTCNPCSQIRNDQVELVEANFENKINIFSECDVSWIFPSNWLMEQFKKSRIYKNENQINVIRNTLDTNTYKIISESEKSIIKSELGFGDNDLILLSGATDNKEKRKGFYFLENLVKKIRKEKLKHSNFYNIKIITFGHGGDLPTGFGIEHIHFGFVDQLKIIKLLQISDLLLFTSTEENFSNLILESLACGCPVLGFNIGGIPEIVKHNINGMLVDRIDGDCYAQSALEIIFGKIQELRKSTEEWRHIAYDNYNYESISKKLINLYKNKEKNIESKRKSYVFRFNKLLSINSSMLQIDTVIVAEQLKKINKNETLSIYKGFTDFENNEEYGKVAWLKKSSSIITKSAFQEDRAIAIICPFAEWNRYNIEKSLEFIQVHSSSQKLPVELIADNESEYCAFVIDISSIGEKYTELEINFSQSVVDENIDNRSLCLLYIAIINLNLNSLKKFETPNEKISHLEKIYLKSNDDWCVNEYYSKIDNQNDVLERKLLLARDLFVRNPIS